MSGTINIYARFGTSPSSLENTNGHVYFTEEDSGSSTHITSPIGKPSGATNTAYSYERWCQFYCAVAPDNQFTNFKVWSGGVSSPVSGVEFRIGTSNSYSGPVVTKSAKATSLLHTSYPSYSEALDVAGTLTSPAQVSTYFVIQAHVTSAAPSGTVDNALCLIHLAYDES